LTISRPTGSVWFTDTDLSMATDFAAQASVAVELTAARADRAQLDLVEDRSRIARDLHDHVIQRLFASGLALQSTALRAPEPLRSAIGEQVGMIDAAIADIRTAVFTLTSQSTAGTSKLRHRILDAVGELAENEAAPRLTFSGAVDLLVVGEVADDVMAVVREGLSNAIRHADAEQIEVDVATDGTTVTVTITDDGRGMDPKTDRSSGTANLAERAKRLGGSFSLTAPKGGGTRLNWSVPLDKGVRT
jgi:signal transduction histidine kinase